jgi:hypothetical protein
MIRAIHKRTLTPVATIAMIAALASSLWLPSCRANQTRVSNNSATTASSNATKTTAAFPQTEMSWDTDPLTLITNPADIQFAGNLVILLIFAGDVTDGQQAQFKATQAVIHDGKENRYYSNQAILFTTVTRAYNLGPGVAYDFTIPQGLANCSFVLGDQRPIYIGDPFNTPPPNDPLQPE